MIQFVFVDFKGEHDIDYLQKTSQMLEKKIPLNSFEVDRLDGPEDAIIIKVVDKSGSECVLFFELATFDTKKQLLIQINIEDPENFSELAYMLKEEIKNHLRKDWNECIWLKDSQSALYAYQLYSLIYNTENSLREFINLLMIKEMGVKWWESYVSENLIKTFKDREGSYKTTAPMYTNIDTMLISLNSDHLSQIMTYKKKKWNPEYNEKIEKLIYSSKEKDLKSVQGILLSQLKTEVDLWKHLFSKYFDDDFINEWGDFCKNRNHIAHNKLIDKRANSIMRKNIKCVQKKIDNAFKRFHSLTLSDESKKELEKIWLEDQKQIMEEESGISVYDGEQIEQFFIEEANRILMLIEDELHFRNDLVLKDYSIEDGKPFFNIQSKLVDEIEIDIYYLIRYLSDEPGGSSKLTIQIILDQETEYSYEIIYQNGKAYFDEDQSNYMPLTQNGLEKLDENLFLEDLNGIIDFHFPNKVNEISISNYTSIKDGGTEVVGDFCCEECGEETVSIDEDFYTFGVCVNCGHEQSSSIKSCMRCEKLYHLNIDGGHSICENCEDFIESQ
ncbi:hypothetical protein [Oceanobacillus kimchii]|uniref:Apea-like HEPN domain-containing protein n=1 Tax=Oceanobacillus kimchii TaxID=746691 RepID=A0ABQ5TNU3_9BACI|nr:hypothetical protein [Oceanobacillus kimchii]GLO68478.1 hypothetical protein MACH08_42620 [Oceanobacillus kimchii]